MNLTPEQLDEVREGIAKGVALIVHAPTAQVLYSRPPSPEERRRAAAASVLLIGAGEPSDAWARARAGLGPTPLGDCSD